MPLKVLTAPNPKLRVKADPVTEFDDALQTFILQMIDQMHHDDGVGLAAPQVGISKQIMVTDITEDDGSGKGVLVMINPKILDASSDTITLSEGCLSLPGIRAEITRPKRVKVSFIDQNYKEQILEADQWLARCILHEYDHLQGKLYIDHLPPLKRKMLLNKSLRYQKTREL
jgi:peptide deformylase